MASILPIFTGKKKKNKEKRKRIAQQMGYRIG